MSMLWCILLPLGVVGLVIWGAFRFVRWAKSRNASPTQPSGGNTGGQPQTPRSATSRNGGWIWWIWAMVVAIILTWGFSTSWGKDKMTTPQAVTGMPIVQRAPQGEWYWVLPAGEYIHGRNESAGNERTVDIFQQRDGSILAELHYMEYGQPETQRIRIYKVGDKSWKGSADQDNPEEHAKLDLIETSPGVYAGEIRWSEKTKGKCYLRTKM